MVLITELPIKPEAIVTELRWAGSGSVLFHFAVVKSKAVDEAVKTTGAVEYGRAGDVEAELSGIVDDMKERFGLDDVLLARRTGKLEVGDVISLVAVSASRSKAAFEACHYGLERLKKMKTIQKTEIYID